MRIWFEKERRGVLFRLMSDCEIAYLSFGLRGLQCEIEFPSDWHEQRRAWVRLGFLFGVFAFSFPWSTVVPDDGQCSGPTYGFHFHDDILWIHYGKAVARCGQSPTITINMPWQWKHREHLILSKPETHAYRYVLKSGEVQERQATIHKESQMWTRRWIPWRLCRRSIDVEFNAEVGERTGSWKGGTLGCGYNLLPNESALDCLRRMEQERKF